jgi:hypothetical protein
MAVCIVGAGRTLSSSLVYKTIPKMSSTSEAQGLLQGSPDLFVHVSVGDSNMSKMRAAMDYLKPIKQVLEDGRGPYPIDERVEKYLASPGCHRGFWDYPCGLGKAMNYHHHIKDCHSLIERYETETKLQYDVIMFARSDLQWSAGLPTKVIRAAVASLPNHATTTLQYDFFMVAPRSVAKDLATMLDDYFTAKCDWTGKHACHKSGYCHDTIPEEIVENAATVSGAKHNAGVDFTWVYEDLYKLVRTWQIPKDDFKVVANDEEYLEEVDGRQMCGSQTGSKKLSR